jgi:hypothetical protein
MPGTTYDHLPSASPVATSELASSPALKTSLLQQVTLWTISSIHSLSARFYGGKAFDPEGYWHLRWDLVMVICTFYALLLTPYELSFGVISQLSILEGTIRFMFDT